MTQPWIRTYYYIRQRCNNPKRRGYGAKGIKCLITKEELEELWVTCEADRMDRPTIDRINNNKHYTFENCRYVELKLNAGRDKHKTHCPKGHPYNGNNLYVNDSRGWTNHVCRICQREAQSKYSKNNREKRNEAQRRRRRLANR